MIVEKQVPLQPHNTFGIVARALHLARIRTEADIAALRADPQWSELTASTPPFVLGGGSNLVITGDVRPLVLKVEIMGRRLIEATDKGWLVEAGAGERWHDFVAWTLEQGWPGLENMALIPGTVGAAPVQNIGAYGIEVKDRLEAVEVMDLVTGRPALLPAAGVSGNCSSCRGSRPSSSTQAGPGKFFIRDQLTRSDITTTPKISSYPI